MPLERQRPHVGPAWSRRCGWGLARRGGTRPGSLLRQSIPIRGSWTEEGPGWLEMDTVALCGGRLDDRHVWMLDAVDIRTEWTELRALENRSQRCTLAQIAHLEASLPFALLGLDSDNGGEFINHHLAAYLGQRPKPVLFTRGRPYHKNDNARVEQRNWTHVRQHFGYERYDHPEVAALMNTLCHGALGQLLNHFLPTHLLKEKRRKGNRTVRVYGPALTPYARVLAAPEVLPAKKAQLQSAASATQSLCSGTGGGAAEEGDQCPRRLWRLERPRPAPSRTPVPVRPPSGHPPMGPRRTT